ncbi:glycosyltransferase [Conexibacter arvalis]|uniref:GT2 family glycosyltransferase/SAM-dependent methyltransferase n=1 Tax=Conexibacter arvalis TaxID=912552 RepID=A0A840IBP3_9ACTN|nr:glycosyltransferase [Conexibacter arvalis]MBB4661524.1 GT2 family glycosyltransferase/SAM-dependent methyltransferase [Conexibacter arvalis]
MEVERRAGAPRLIDWTGERCVPWAPDVQVIYEHYHRYLWAAQLADGRRVLDIGSGEGFGSAILAGSAASVLGIDVDELTVEHARLNYAARNLEYRLGSALELEALAPREFDMVVAFELIEHVDDHVRVLEGITRLLAPDGIVVMSTPDRRMYTDATGQRNPFHEHELTVSEFHALLSERFPAVRLYGQRAAAGSRIASLEAVERPEFRGFSVRRVGQEWHLASPPPAMYLVGVAAQGDLPELPAESQLNDFELGIINEYVDRAANARQEATLAQRRLEEAETARALAERAVEERTARLRAELDASYDRCAEQSRQIEAARLETRRLIEAHAGEVAELHRIRESVVWNGFQRVRGVLYRTLGGRDSRRGRAVQWTLRTAARAVGRSSSPPEHKQDATPIAPIELPTSEQPLVSLVIPAYIGADITEACLRSIASRTEGPSFEVIVVDDAGDEENARLWAAVRGARILDDSPGTGYLRSVNRAAAQARGRYLVLMNNDVEVSPGWLRALVARAASADDIGAVAPKLLYPDGRVQEAGGIVFRDGSGWNFGNGGPPEHHEFNYVREVDYGSAACLLVRRDLFAELGGYDERFVPMYYEDTDLCFSLRAKGYRVMYEPTAHVVHHEGASAGTDLTTGGKRYQAINQHKFVEKWKAQLEADHLRMAHSNVPRASNRNRGPHVMVIDHRVPTPDQDSGSLRMFRLLETLLDLGCRVTFVPDDLNPIEPYTSQLQSRGIEVVYGDAWVGEEIARIGPHLKLAIVSRPYVAPKHMHLIREHAPGAVIAYDTVDLHFVRERRRAELGEPHAVRKAATMEALELGIVRGSDATLVVSDEERPPIEEAAPEATVLVVPNANEVAAVVPPPEGRTGILFVGGFEHPPNVDAALLLIQSIMPIVWQRLGDVRVTIAGSKPTPEIEALAGPNVDVTGWVEELQPLLDGSRLLAAPLRYGAGMKGKVTQSLGAGLPVVTTETGAEGLGAVDGENMLVADDIEGIAARIVELYEDDGLWRRLSSAGQEVVRQTASVDVMRERLRTLLDLGA